MSETQYGYDAYRRVEDENDNRWELYEESITGTIALESADAVTYSSATTTTSGIVRLASSISANDNGCTTGSQVYTAINALNLSSYATTASLTTAMATVYTKSEAYSTSQVDSLISDFTTEDEVTSLVNSSIADITGFASETYVDTALSAAALSTDTKLASKMDASESVTSIEVLTQAEYDALSSPDDSTLYLIKNED